MNRLELRPIELADSAAAGALLAARHRRHRTRCPLLDEAYESPAAATAEVATLLSAEGASGAWAVRDGQPVGFMVGAPRPDGVWGPNVWIEGAGSAANEPEVIRDLYAFAAQRWVDQGRTAHYALVPATEPDQLSAWSRSGFGQQQMHALRPVTPRGAGPAPDGTALRLAVSADLDALAELDLLLPKHLRRSPVFSPIKVPTFDEARAEAAEEFDDPGQVIVVADRDGEVAGVSVGVKAEISRVHVGLARPPGAAVLGMVSVFPQFRGLGLGRLLSAAVLDWASDEGFACVVTDWRAANLESSRIWPRLGFNDSFVRLHRLVGY